MEETLGAFDELIRAGKVRHIASSNFSAPRLAHALATSAREGLPAYVAVQDHYNLMDRDEYERGPRDVVEANGLSCAPYYALAMGFLTGKYRPGGDLGDSPRAEGAAAYLDARGERVLEALDEVAAAHDATVAAVSLAWLVAQPTVVSAVASGRTPEQVEALMAVARLELSPDEIERLSAASAT
jgi:aryl-alcohol dehydrogenase-like predicted oxidoreductase